ncbi:hypothetical protein DVF23_16940 [Salmonella enterica subsp. enterica serovar Teko]|nr:hypothetical protein [Salmonella enterica subsp. enterica serovar Teko]
MPARQACQNFFRDTLAPFHKYRQHVFLDTMTLAQNQCNAKSDIFAFLQTSDEFSRSQVI